MKVDKAEVLELAVEFLATIQSSSGIDPSARRTAYATGFKDCARESVLFLGRTGSVPRQTVHDLTSHLLRISDTKHIYPPVRETSVKGDFSPELHFTSTPVLSSGSFQGNTSFHRDSASPELDKTPAILSTDVIGASVQISHFPVCNISLGSDMFLDSTRSISPISDTSYSDKSASLSSSVSSANSGSELVFKLVAKEEPVWRPW